MSHIGDLYNAKNTEKQVYLAGLENIIRTINVGLEGNCFYHHASLQLFPELLTKQQNIFWCGLQVPAEGRICEIGFNAGHSTMLLLLGRDQTPIDFTVFDIGHHAYTKPCLEYIKQKFAHVNFEYIEGDSIVTMPAWIEQNKHLTGTYDVVHVDGGHTYECISNDMKNANLLLKKDGIMIVDDTQLQVINLQVDMYISNGKYVELTFLKSAGYPHRVIRKIQI